MAEEKRQYEQSYALQYKQYEENIRQFDEEIARLKAQDKVENDYKIAQLQLQRDQLTEQQTQWDEEYDLKLKEYRLQEKAYEDSKNNNGGGINESGIDKSNLVTNSAYWNGERAENVGGLGYFSNGYQPKGVKINGKAYEVKSTNVKFDKTNTTLWGTKETKQITVWTAGGKYFYWNGPDNKYVELSKDEAKSLGVNITNNSGKKTTTVSGGSTMGSYMA